MNKIHYKDKIVVVFFLLLTLIVFYKALFQHNVVLYSPHSDAVSQILPAKIFLEAHLANGIVPLWYPAIFGGLPFFINPVTSITLHPLNVIFYLLHINPHFSLQYSIYFIIAMLGMYVFARYLNLSRSASVCSAIVFSLNRMMISRVYAGHIWLIAEVVFMPLLFYQIVKFRKSFTHVFYLSITIYFLLAGLHFQEVLYISFIAAIFTILKYVKNPIKIVYIGASFMLAICFFSYHLFPLYDIVHVSNRKAMTYEQSVQNDFHPFQSIDLVLPKALGNIWDDTYWGPRFFWETSIYIGILPLFFIFFLYRTKWNFYMKFSLFMILFGMSYALGRFFIVHPFFFNFVPGFNLFRVPSRMLFITLFGAAILSGYGFDNFFSQNAWSKRKIIMFSLLMSLICIPLFLLAQPSIRELGANNVEKRYNNVSDRVDVPIEYYLAKIDTILNGIMKSLILLTGTLFCILLLTFFPKKYAMYLAIIILVFDLFIINLPLIEVKKYEEIVQSDPIIEFIQKDDSYFRILDLSKQYPQSKTIPFNIEQFAGYDPMILDVFTNFSKTANYPSISDENIDDYSSWNIKYILSKSALQVTNVSSVFVHNNITVYQNNNVLPRIRFSDGRGNIQINSYTPNRINIDTHRNQSGELIVADVYFSWWEVYIDGQKQNIIKTKDNLRSVKVDKGSHNIEFRYNIPKTGMWISLVSLIISLGLFVYTYKKESKKQVLET